MTEDFQIRGLRGILRLTSDCLELVAQSKAIITMPLVAICGASPNQAILDQFILIYHQSGKNSSIDVRCPTALQAKAWVDKIRAALGARRGVSQPHVLLLVNPKAGQGRAQVVTEKSVIPVLEASGATVDIRETQHIGHAEEMCQTIRVQDYDTIAVVSGDGLIHEVVNGLLGRSDATDISTHISLAVIPCGSGNALAASLGLRNVDTAVWSLAQGGIRALDIAACWLDGTRKFLFTNMLFAILCDVDFFSEGMRALGEARFTLQGVWEVLRYRSQEYKVKLQLLVADSFLKEECQESGCSICSQPTPLQIPAQFSEKAEEGFTWMTIEDKVPFFACQNSKLVSASTKSCPFAHLCDGTLDVCLLRGANNPTRFDLVKVLLSMDAGDHLRALPKLEYFKVKALRFTPLWDGGQLGIDGERMPFGPLDLRLCQGSLRIISHPPSSPPIVGLPTSGQGPFSWWKSESCSP